MMIVFLDLVH